MRCVNLGGEKEGRDRLPSFENMRREGKPLLRDLKSRRRENQDRKGKGEKGRRGSSLLSSSSRDVRLILEPTPKEPREQKKECL